MRSLAPPSGSTGVVLLDHCISPEKLLRMGSTLRVSSLQGKQLAEGTKHFRKGIYLFCFKHPLLSGTCLLKHYLFPSASKGPSNPPIVASF
jgi:hypothetical protein